MSERIAEFVELDDARRFQRMKGADYSVCGGISLMWAVMPRIRYDLDCGTFEPRDAGSAIEDDE